jgi:hypothetical protein
MSRSKTILFLISLVCLQIVAWLFMHDLLVCAYTLINSLFFLSIVLRFPDSNFLLINKLKDIETQKGNIEISIPRKKNFHSITVEHIELTKFVNTKTRIHDSNRLINETKKGLYTGLIIYLFLFLGGLFTSYLVKHYGAKYDEGNLSMYKDIISVIYIGLAFIYIIYYCSPINSQRNHNKNLIEA